MLALHRDTLERVPFLASGAREPEMVADLAAHMQLQAFVPGGWQRREAWGVLCSGQACKRLPRAAHGARQLGALCEHANTGVCVGSAAEYRRAWGSGRLGALLLLTSAVAIMRSRSQARWS